jgi:hypothetical protein
MVLQSSGAISLNDIQTEFGGTNPIGINEYYDAADGVPASGEISFDDFYGKSSISGLYKSMLDLNSSLSSYTYSQVSNIKTAIENEGFTLIATPTYGSLAESMSGTTNITSTGTFNYSEFDSGTTLATSDGFVNTTLNGYPYMVMAGFGPNGFAGTAAMMYRDYTTATALKDFFYPNQDRNLYTFVLNANGTEIADTSGTTSTIFSDGQSPGTNGYNSTSRFASDDGSWGFVTGTTRLDGNGGPYHNGNSTKAYGCANQNGGDTTGANYFYWGANGTSSTTYCFYIFVKNT